MVATTAATYTATTDGEQFYVQDGDGGFHRDHRGMIAVYDNVEDAVEVAAALTEGRTIRPRHYPAPPAPRWVQSWVEAYGPLPLDD